jgi:folate-dependent phosphoribosylglycinamide formyltransferase PurN
MSSDVALLCGADDMSLTVANALRREFGEIAILVEERESRKVFLKRRAKRLGWLTVAGQAAFALIAPPLLRRRSRGRITELAEAGRLDFDRSALDRADFVRSVNSLEAIAWLERKRPNVVVVNGTRIIARGVLEATDAAFINMHCGITPKYRGAHGAYWARAQGDRDGCGVTIHLVDPGIDTGDILAQRRIEVEPEDNFATYPFLQVGAGLPLLIDAVKAALEGRLEPRASEAPSTLWYHPTLWQYIATGLRRRIW